MADVVAAAGNGIGVAAAAVKAEAGADAAPVSTTESNQFESRAEDVAVRERERVSERANQPGERSPSCWRIWR